MLTSLMMPSIVTMIPTFVMWSKLGFTNSLVPLAVPIWFGGSVYNIFLFRQFFLSIPRELDEAATIDGCGRAGIFFHIVFPVAKPGIATVATITFLNCWNDLLLGLVLISTPARKTLSMTISALKGSYVTQYGLLCAGFVISIVPVVFMYLLFQKQVIAGMTAGAVKG